LSSSAKIKAFVRQEAAELGFDSVGFTHPDSIPKAPKQLREFLNNEYHGSMGWLAETEARRSDPKTLWPDVRSVITLAMNYGPETNPLPQLEKRSEGTISVYARHRDYHDLIKGKLKTLSSKLISRAKELGASAELKVFVDTAPVMEKPLSQQAGLGWQGKHTNLVSQDFGSWLFLGSIFTTLKIEPDRAESDHCGSCSNCLDICPTGAFPAPYKLDARRCISYLTIEHAGPIDHEFRKPMGNRIYGCDDCLAICPWNKFAKTTQEAKLATPKVKASNQLIDFLQLDDAAFRYRFSGSPVKRIGRNRFIRNCLIASGNSNQSKLVPIVEDLAQEKDEVVAEAARWALIELKGQT
jgi:epoxyqueuosine reductase